MTRMTAPQCLGYPEEAHILDDLPYLAGFGHVGVALNFSTLFVPLRLIMAWGLGAQS